MYKSVYIMIYICIIDRTHTNGERDMKDKNGKNLVPGDLVSVSGDNDPWMIMSAQDNFGDVLIQNTENCIALHRHPSSLVAFEG